MTTDPVSPAAARSDVPFYALAALAGIGTGWADLTVNDLLLTALLVLAACMLLGLLRPHWPWRWVMTVTVFIPLTELIAALTGKAHPTRAQIYGSFLCALPGIAGAYGGSIVRGVVDHLKHGT